MTANLSQSRTSGESSTRFTDLVALLRSLDLEDPGSRGPRRPPRDNVRTVQHSLTAWLADESFYLDCVELELAAVLRKTPEWPQPPMYRLPDRAMHVRMFYWGPGKVAPPHEHTAWTVTAVFYNSLEVTTFDWDVAVQQRRLQQKSSFGAAQGAAGHIYEPGIHSPANHSQRVSTSIHIFNASDQPRLEREVGPVDGLGSPNPGFIRGADEAMRLDALRQRQLRVLVQLITQFHSERALRMLRTIASFGDNLTQAVADRAAWSLARNDGDDRGTAPDVRIENG